MDDSRRHTTGTHRTPSLALWLVLALSVAGNIGAPLMWPGTLLQPVSGAIAVASIVLLVVQRLRRSRS